jgi:hypothetical protein
MSRTISPSSDQPYGLARVCRIWRVARASVRRHRNPQPDRQRRVLSDHFPIHCSPLRSAPSWRSMKRIQGRVCAGEAKASLARRFRHAERHQAGPADRDPHCWLSRSGVGDAVEEDWPLKVGSASSGVAGMGRSSPVRCL